MGTAHLYKTDTMLDSTDSQISRRTHAIPKRAIVATASAAAAQTTTATSAHEGAGCFLPDSASSHQLYQQAEMGEKGNLTPDFNPADLEGIEISNAGTVWHGIETTALIFGLIATTVVLFLISVCCCISRGGGGDGDVISECINAAICAGLCEMICDD